MAATDANLSEALDLLQGRQWHAVAEGIIKGEYAFWVGSGISRGRFPDLCSLLKTLLERLQFQAKPADPNCPYIRTLGEILDLTTISRSDVDFSRVPNEWTKLDDLVGQLRGRYSQVLDCAVRLGGRDVKDLCWDILELPKMYGDSSVLPDAEHTFLALLIEEGLLAEIVTTNWDPLIEVAHERCRAARPNGIHVVACNDELDGSRNTRSTRVLKIHGCARKALRDGSRYKPFMVATSHHITKWKEDPQHAPFREALRTLLRERPTLFVGLSGQDWNIQAECFSAFSHSDHVPIVPPRIVFCEPSVQGPQRAILKNVYGEETYNKDAGQIDDLAALPLYAKPLLGALYILALFEKAKRILTFGRPEFSADHVTFAEDAFRELELFLRSRYDGAVDPSDPARCWRQLAAEVPRAISRFVEIYREQCVVSDQSYNALYGHDLAAMATDSNLRHLGFHWLVLVLSVFWMGDRRGRWRLRVKLASRPLDGQFEVECSGRFTKVFVVQAADTGLGKLIQNGLLDPNNHGGVLIVYPNGQKPAVSRPGRPRRLLPGGKSATWPRQLWFRDATESVPTVDELVEVLRNKVM